MNRTGEILITIAELTASGLRAEIGALTQLLEAERRPPRRRRDRDADGRLISALAVSFGSAVFSAGDVLRHAAHQAELVAALEGASGRAVGARLRRLHGQGGRRLCGHAGGTRREPARLGAGCMADSHAVHRPETQTRGTIRSCDTPPTRPRSKEQDARAAACVARALAKHSGEQR